jgi:hypothetical protein
MSKIQCRMQKSPAVTDRTLNLTSQIHACRRFSASATPCMILVRPLEITLIILALTLVACSDHGNAQVSHADATQRSVNIGYGILRATLKDERHLKTIRLTKTIVTFKSISEPTRRIIDDIAQTSSTALEELEQLASLSPGIIFDAERGGQIEQMTRDALRITTVKEFLASKDEFEVIFLISQTQALRFISHLTKELSVIEINAKRKEWLGRLSYQYEQLYLRVISRLKIA